MEKKCLNCADADKYMICHCIDSRNYDEEVNEDDSCSCFTHLPDLEE